jgi:hypothetical protein
VASEVERADVVIIPRGHRAMDRLTEDRLVDLAVGGSDAKTKGEFKLEIIDVAAELAGPDPSPIEASLARTGALCWFTMRAAEAQFAVYMKGKDVTVAGAEYRQRRINHAHRRYLSTLRTLAQVRKLARPMIQVNVARQQVNVAGAMPSALATPTGER